MCPDCWDVKGEVELAVYAPDEDEVDGDQQDGHDNGNSDTTDDEESDRSMEENEEEDDLRDSDPNHYFEDEELARGIEYDGTTDEDEDTDTEE